MLYLCSQLFTFYTKYQTHCPSLVSPPIQLSFSSGIQVECGVLRALPAPHCYFCCSIDIACCVRRHSTSPIHSLTASSSLLFFFSRSVTFSFLLILSALTYDFVFPCVYLLPFALFLLASSYYTFALFRSFVSFRFMSPDSHQILSLHTSYLSFFLFADSFCVLFHLNTVLYYLLDGQLRRRRRDGGDECARSYAIRIHICMFLLCFIYCLYRLQFASCYMPHCCYFVMFYLIKVI